MNKTQKEILEFIKLTKQNLVDDEECGGWCIRCSLAKAMGKFGDDKDRISTSEAMRQIICNDVCLTSRVDFIMDKTRKYLKQFGDDEDMIFKTRKATYNFLKGAEFSLAKQLTKKQ